MGEIRLPQNEKEGLLYGFTICIITVFVMLLLNVGTAMGGLGLDVLIIILKLVPIIFIVAFLLESFIVGRIAGKLVERFTEPTDSFNTKILFNILFCVTMMSASMTIIGGTIGSMKLSWEPFLTFFAHWPRNFCVAFWTEVLLAQPLARCIMKKVHITKLKKNKGGNNDEE